MTLDWGLRPAVDDDLGWLAELRADVLREHLVRVGVFDEQRVRQRFRDGYAADRTSVIVVDGAPVGCVALRGEDDGVWLEHFYLNVDLQGRGIGGGIVEWAIEQAAGRTIRLSVLDGSPARRLYERHGFVVHGRSGVDLLMCRPPVAASGTGRRSPRVAVMETRQLGRTHRTVSVVGLGAWQLGADWGDVDEDEALTVITAAVDSGVTVIDTADVYGDGRSERIIGRWLREHPDSGVTVATKVGRRLPPVLASFTRDNLAAWVDRSRDNLGVETLDLVQLHCPETAVYGDDAVFQILDDLVADKAIAAYGVSVETCAEALTAIARPGVASVQIVFNALRQKPMDEVLPAAAAAGVAVIARVPLASGLLSGRYDEDTTFGEDDHRNYNRTGAAFDVGETFAGVPYEIGLQAVRELRHLVRDGETMAQLALRWIIDQPAVTVVIPGARNTGQAQGNAAAAGLPPLTDAQRTGIRDIYDRVVRPHVHDRW